MPFRGWQGGWSLAALDMFARADAGLDLRNFKPPSSAENERECLDKIALEHPHSFPISRKVMPDNQLGFNVADMLINFRKATCNDGRRFPLDQHHAKTACIASAASCRAMSRTVGASGSTWLSSTARQAPCSSKCSPCQRVEIWKSASLHRAGPRCRRCCFSNSARQGLQTPLGVNSAVRFSQEGQFWRLATIGFNEARSRPACPPRCPACPPVSLFRRRGSGQRAGPTVRWWRRGGCRPP